MLQSTLDAYESQFKIRRAIKGKNSLEVTFPFSVVEKEAKLLGITVNQFIKKFVVVAQYNGFNGVRYIFRKNDGGK